MGYATTSSKIDDSLFEHLYIVEFSNDNADNAWNKY